MLCALALQVHHASTGTCVCKDAHLKLVWMDGKPQCKPPCAHEAGLVGSVFCTSHAVLKQGGVRWLRSEVPHPPLQLKSPLWLAARLSLQVPRRGEFLVGNSIVCEREIRTAV